MQSNANTDKNGDFFDSIGHSRRQFRHFGQLRPENRTLSTCHEPLACLEELA